MTARPIIIASAPGNRANADGVACVHRERDILAEDIAAAGGRLLAAIAVMKSRETSDFIALMFTSHVDPSTDLFGACNASRPLLERMIEELKSLKSIGFGGPFEMLLEVSFGDEVILSYDKSFSMLPAMTATKPEGDKPAQ